MWMSSNVPQAMVVMITATWQCVARMEAIC